MRGHSLREAIEDYHRRAKGKAVIDYAFHTIVTDPTPQVYGQELPSLIEDGYSSFKVYMTYDDLKLNDRQILDVLAVARRHRGMVMIHAENTDCIAWLTDRLEEAGKTAPRYHATSRPRPVEREATHRAITLAEVLDVPVLIVHVSAREAAWEIRRAQKRGLKVYGETCPQYLFLTEDDLAKPEFEGAKCMCSPPPRDAENQQVIWDGLRNGAFQVFSSDHAPTRYDDPKGKKLRGTEASFRWVPNGVPGIETRLALLFSEGVGKGRIELTTFVALTATNPARMYGLYPRKGTIAVGLGRRHRGVGRRPRRHHHQRHPAPQRGLHSLRGDAHQGLAGNGALARRGGVGRRRGKGPPGPRRLPALRHARHRGAGGPRGHRLRPGVRRHVRDP